MSKTTEEKIDEIHDIVVRLMAERDADKRICEIKHEAVDSRLSGLHRVIKGNDTKGGLEQNHADLVRRFDKLEVKIVAWASVAVFVGQLIGPKVLEMAGWK